VELALI
jgi:hypothetical protein